VFERPLASEPTPFHQSHLRPKTAALVSGMEVDASLRCHWQTATSGSLDDSARSCVEILASRGLLSALCARVLADVERVYVEPAATILQQLASLPQTDLPDEGLAASTLDRAYTLVAAGTARIQWLDDSLADENLGLMLRFALRCRSVFAAKVSKTLSSVLYGIYLQRFREFGLSRGDKSRLSTENHAQFRYFGAQLHALGFLPAIQEAISWVLFEEIDEHVRSHAMTQICDRALPSLRDWVDMAVIPWLEAVLSATEQPSVSLMPDLNASVLSNSTHQGSVSLDQWRKRLAFHLHDTLAAVRIEQILQFVELFPKSIPALEDLKECLMRTDKKALLIRSLREQFSSRLLHAGTMTSTIIQQYINMIKALRCLDPQSVVLESVSDPIRECLRRRPDTIRCIVSGMTGNGDLYEELERGRYKVSQSRDSVVAEENPRTASGARLIPGLSSSSMAVGGVEEEDGDSDAGDDSEAEELDEEEFATWEPEPIDAPPRQGRWRPGGDAIATLFAIYGSSEQLVKEYQILLADKLINNFDVDFDREARILELLQQRFGAPAMHDCVVMLKDIRDSRETLALAKAERRDVGHALQNFEATIMSKEFWPKLAEEPVFKPSPEFATSMNLFTSSFERVKGPRKLNWQQGLGMVVFRVTFDDGRVLDMTSTPLQAAIVQRFAERSKWTVEELLNDMEMNDESALRRRLVLLANQDVIRATDSSASSYETIEKAEDVDSTGGTVDDETGHGLHSSMGDGDGPMDENAEMAVYEPYIFAMLRNLGQLPLERIHNMLQMFVKTPAYDKTQAQLAAFLTKLVGDEKLGMRAGLYNVREQA
jgi:anaphase-promoting complex subunit 2